MARGHYLQYTLKEQLVHGMQVSNLAWSVARRMGLSDDFCHQVAVAGMLHDIGKEEISGQIDENQERLVVEEMHYVRLHAAAGYEILKREGYPEEIQKMVLHHHENMDGSGYPDNLSGEKIPLGARIIRVCDVYAALLSDRPYRKGFDQDTAIQLMIEEIKNFDMKIFLTFQRVIHEENNMEIILPPIEI
ncbi:MAG: HD domain-containing protein [Clostridiales bacterium]|nr:HD domain-containing protein [Clostridiales bacterium]